MRQFLTFSATGLPVRLGIDPASGLITGTLDDYTVSPTPYSVTVTVSNGIGGTASQTFPWGVNPEPVTAQAAAVSGVEGNDTGKVTVATFTTPDLTCSARDFTAWVTWGDGTSDAGEVTGGNGSYTVAADHNNAEKGTYPVSVALVAHDGAGTTVTTTATVADAPLRLTGGFQLGAVVGQITPLVLASVTDGNPNAPVTEYIKTINWGDGGTETSQGLPSDPSGVYPVGGPHTYANAGIYTVTLTVTDVEGATATVTSTVVVGDLYAGVASTFTIPGFWDDNPSTPASTFSATIAWGDGSTTSYPVVGSNGNYALAAPLTHTYPTDSLGQPGGVYQITVTVYDSDSTPLTGSGSVMVVRPPLTLAVGEVATGPSSLTVNNVEVADFTEWDTSDTTSEFAATIFWGDGTSSAGVISGGTEMFRVFGTHTYANPGFYTLTVLVAQGWDASLTAAEQGGEAMGGKLADQITIPQRIRDRDTPTQMTQDRIAPGWGYWYSYSLGNSPASEYPFHIKVEGGSAANGRAAFLFGAVGRPGQDGYVPDSKLSTDMVLLGPGVAKGDFQLYGALSTAGTNVRKPTLDQPGGGGNAGKLYLAAYNKAGKELKRSAGFSVAAIPINPLVVFQRDVNREIVDGIRRSGVRVDDRWESDSGTIDDLNQLFDSEQVERNGKPTGEFATTTLQTSTYFDDPANVFPFDFYVVTSFTLDDAVRNNKPSRSVLNQVLIFHDFRTGAMDIPITASGYQITKDVNKSTGQWTYTVTVMGAAVKANGFSSGAGATVPKNGIQRTPA